MADSALSSDIECEAATPTVHKVKHLASPGAKPSAKGKGAKDKTKSSSKISGSDKDEERQHRVLER